MSDELKRNNPALRNKYGITGKEGFTEELVEQIEAEIEKGIDTVFEWSEQYSPMEQQENCLI